jgi:predicted transglutaminase-like cysteine proteinase
MELAAEQDTLTQLSVVHEYFNTTGPAAEGYDRSGRDVWEPLYVTASTLRADCEDIALAKYFTLRRLGWAAQDLRVLVGWDKQERDWHAMLAVRLDDDRDGDIYVLDNILGFRRVSAFRGTRLVYSISELGIWDHAPDSEPVPKRAARIAAVVAGD